VDGQVGDGAKWGATMMDILQGKWLGHPLHPILVHVPVALWPAALVFDLLSRFGVGGNAMVLTSFYAILVGLVVAVPTVATGLADWSGIKRDRPAWKIGLLHMLLNIAVVLLQIVNLALRWGGQDQAEAVGTTPLLLSALATLGLLVSGYLGGRLVYDYGISVARLSKERWRHVAAAGGARLPKPEKG
jgi:uncharacterized membrane protein